MSSRWDAALLGLTLEHTTACVEATTFVRTLEKRQGQRIACPEEIAFLRGFITRRQLIHLGERIGKSAYGQYLIQVAREAS